jgi:CD109 antigen
MMRLEITPVDKKIIEDALDLVAQRQNVNGKFEMIDYTYYSLSETPISSQVHYTCFALLGFVTNHGFVKDYSNVINKAFFFVRNNPSINNYAASVCAYAAAHYDLTLARSFLSKLEKVSYTDGIDRYWDDVKGYHSGSCARMQIASYVALTYIKLEQYSNAKQIINWLLKQRQANGEFCYTFTSGVGFEALSEYAAYYKVENTDMEVKVETEAKKPKTTRVNNGNAKEVQVLIMPNNNHNATVTGTGYGFAQVQLHYSYTKVVEQFSNYFVMNVNTIVSNFSIVRVCVRKTKVSDSDMIMIEMNLPSGFTYQAEMTSPMVQSKLVQVKFFDSFCFKLADFVFFRMWKLLMAAQLFIFIWRVFQSLILASIFTLKELIRLINLRRAQ